MLLAGEEMDKMVMFQSISDNKGANTSIADSLELQSESLQMVMATNNCIKCLIDLEQKYQKYYKIFKIMKIFLR